MNQVLQPVEAVTEHPNSHNAARISDGIIGAGFWVGGFLIVLGIVITILSSRANPKVTP